VALYIELNEAKTRGWSDKIGTFGDLRPIYLVFCAFEPDSGFNTREIRTRRHRKQTARGNRIHLVLTCCSPALGKFMTAKSRFMAALIVLLAHFATAATARSQKDPT
jgi:hypothetical protein